MASQSIPQEPPSHDPLRTALTALCNAHTWRDGLRHRDLDRRAGGGADRRRPVRGRVRLAGPARPRRARARRAPAMRRPAARAPAARSHGPSARRRSASSSRRATTASSHAASSRSTWRRRWSGCWRSTRRPPAPGESARQDAALRVEVRQLVIARNERRLARGRGRRSTSRRRWIASCATSA